MNPTSAPQNLAIILPCYNPKQDWHVEVASVIKELNMKIGKTLVEVILVNDGSTENVLSGHIDYLKGSFNRFTYIELPENSGKGAALRAGMSEAKSDLFMYTDIDFPYTLDSMAKVFDALWNDQADIVIAVRDARYYDQVPFLRKMISRILKFMIRGLLSIPITDTQGGLKAFNKKGREQFLQTTINRYLFDLEFVYRSSKEKGLHMIPVEVELKQGVTFSSMGINVLMREGINFFKILFR